MRVEAREERMEPKSAQKETEGEARVERRRRAGKQGRGNEEKTLVQE